MSKEVDAADKLNFAVQSPIESLLVAAVSRRAMQKIPSLELDGGGGGGGRDGGRDGGGSGEGDGKGGGDGNGGGNGDGKGDGDGGRRPRRASEKAWPPEKRRRAGGEGASCRRIEQGGGRG